MSWSSKIWWMPILNWIQIERENQMPIWELLCLGWKVDLSLIGKFEPFPLKIWNATLKMKCVPGNSAQLSYWQIFECLDKIWRTLPKFQNNILTTRGLAPLARVLTKESVLDFLKVLKCECWWGFRCDDPGWPCFDPSEQVWPVIKVN
jgi:hypothetical protein